MKKILAPATLIIAQAQNALNDSMVRLIITNLIFYLALGALSKNIANILLAFIPFTIIALSPIAGFIADNCSKKKVFTATLISQLFILAFVWIALIQKNHILAITAFFLLSVQSAFFSPIKVGIIKEIVPENKISLTTSLMQLLLMIAILAGMTLAGLIFDHNLKQSSDPWLASIIPIKYLVFLSILPIIATITIKNTPAASNEKFSFKILFNYKKNLSNAFHDEKIKKIIIGIMTYWFLSYFMGIIVIDISAELKKNAVGIQKSIGTDSSKMLFALTLGIAVGNLFAGIINKNKPKLQFIKIYGIAIVSTLILIAILKNNSFLPFLFLLGTFSGLFIVPLISAIQIFSKNTQRGRILATSSFMSSFAGLIAVIISFILKLINVSPWNQFYVFASITLIAILYVTKK